MLYVNYISMKLKREIKLKNSEKKKLRFAQPHGMSLREHGMTISKVMHFKSCSFILQIKSI